MNLPDLVDSTLTLDDRVALLTLRRDDVRNALTGTALVDDIVTAVQWANRCPEVSVMILTGEGKAFSSGGNIKEMARRERTFGGSPLEIQEKYRHGIQQLPLALHSAEIPLVAAINGPAIGAGLDLACMCDLRIASRDARFGETFINLGLIPGDGGAWFLQRLIGYQKAADLTLSGRIFDAEEALRLGLILEAAKPDQVLPRARELAAEMAAKSPHTLRLTKRLLKQALRTELPDFLDLCASFQGMVHHSDDHLDAVKAFLAQRA